MQDIAHRTAVRLVRLCRTSSVPLSPAVVSPDDRPMADMATARPAADGTPKPGAVDSPGKEGRTARLIETVLMSNESGNEPFPESWFLCS